MKTLDDVIEGLGSPYYNTFKKYIGDAVAYLKLYRSDKLQWEREKDDMQSRYQEAIDNCEKAENRFKAALKRLDIGTLNEPLTWDELQQMEGRPVWYEHEFWKGWIILGKVEQGVNCEMIPDREERWYIVKDGSAKAYRRENR